MTKFAWITAIMTIMNLDMHNVIVQIAVSAVAITILVFARCIPTNDMFTTAAIT